MIHPGGGGQDAGVRKVFVGEGLPVPVGMSTLAGSDVAVGSISNVSVGIGASGI